MLTIEQLRAMPEAVREGYLRQTHNQIATDERAAIDWQCDAEHLERKARALRDDVGRLSARAREARAYFATLEAAGLWPVAAPGGATKEQL